MKYITKWTVGGKIIMGKRTTLMTSDAAHSILYALAVKHNTLDKINTFEMTKNGKILFSFSHVFVGPKEGEPEVPEPSLPPCPFCGGRVVYREAERDIRQPDMIQCVGECFFEIMCDYEKGEALNWYLKAGSK